MKWILLLNFLSENRNRCLQVTAVCASMSSSISMWNGRWRARERMYQAVQEAWAGRFKIQLWGVLLFWNTIAVHQSSVAFSLLPRLFIINNKVSKIELENTQTCHLFAMKALLLLIKVCSRVHEDIKIPVQVHAQIPSQTQSMTFALRGDSQGTHVFVTSKRWG